MDVVLFVKFLCLKDCCACVMRHTFHNVTKQKKNGKQEEEWKRLGHELMTSQPNDVDHDCSVPLSILSNHTVLSWHHHNENNGKTKNASKIGFKFVSKNKYCSSSDLQVMIS